MSRFGRGLRHPGCEPTPGHPWDSPLNEVPFLFVDVELTGLNLESDRVVEICMERVVAGELQERISTVVNPGDVRGAEHIHGIQECEFEQAPSFSVLAPRVCALLDGSIVVAHHAEVDCAFLQKELSRVGMSHTSLECALDTLVLSRRVLYLNSYRLSAVAASLGVNIERAHRADGDVRTLRLVWEKLLEKIAPSTARDVYHVRVGEKAVRPHIYERLQQASVRKQPVSITYRPHRGDPDTFAFVVLSVEATHLSGYEISTRSRRELRLDRVLKVDVLDDLCVEHLTRTHKQ